MQKAYIDITPAICNDNISCHFHVIIMCQLLFYECIAIVE